MEEKAEQSPVLVADDNAVNQRLMSLLLTSLTVKYEMVSDGRAAVVATMKNKYSLILMDINMPEMDGFEAAYQIRKHEFENGEHTPIVACTALDKHRILEQAIRCGMDDFIGKPISRLGLKEKIERWTRVTVRPKAISRDLATQVRQLHAASSDPVDEPYIKLLYGLEQLDDILILFLTVTETLLAQLESAMQNHDISVVRRMAHEIKSSSYAVSAREMAQLCLDLENASEENDWPEALKIYAALGLAFARVRQFINDKPQVLRRMEDAS